MSNKTSLSIVKIQTKASIGYGKRNPFTEAVI